MLALSFTFPAGRYHATPWDRHVNEGAVSWPPEPWRILRGLIFTWHHKVKHTGKHCESTLTGLIESLTRELPQYSLPAASHSHTRHYMPQFATGDTKLVFDAFTAVKRNDPLTVIWPNLELPDEQRQLLDDLLSVMGYLGRAESWVEAKRIAEAPEPNCKPGSSRGRSSLSTHLCRRTNTNPCACAFLPTRRPHKNWTPPCRTIYWMHSARPRPTCASKAGTSRQRHEK